MYTVNNLITDIATVTHGTKTNKIPNLYGIISRAARAVLLDINPKETQKIVQVPQVFNDVFDYPCPTDLKSDKIIDLRLQAGRQPSDVFTQTYAMTFDSEKLRGVNQRFYTQWNTGVKTLRIEAPTLTAPLVITDTSSLTGWSVTAGAQNISLDVNNNVAGGGAIQFDLAAGSATGSIQISTLNPIDMTNHVNVDSEFYWAYLPTGASITNLNLKWGSDYTANYYTYTVTTTQQGTTFQDGWNLISIPWNLATKVGSPVVTAYDSVQLTITYNSTLQTGVKFCNLTSNLGTIFELQYYSKYLFRDPSTNAFQEAVIDTLDNGKIINLDTDSYNLLFNKTAFFVSQALQGADNSYDADYWQTEYKDALALYKAQNPSEQIKKTEVYYKLPKKGNRGFGNPIWRP
jgi:hypothetical protein